MGGARTIMTEKINLYFENNGIHASIFNRQPYLNAIPADLVPQVIVECTNNCHTDAYFGGQGSQFFKRFVVNTAIPEGKKFYYPIIFSLTQLLDHVDSLFIPFNILSAIETGTCKVLIVCTYEGWCWPTYERLVESIAANNHITVDKFVIMSANYTNHYRYNTVYFNHWEIASRHRDTDNDRKIAHDTIFNQSPRTYKFICLNRRAAYFRFAVLTKLFPYRNQGLLSFWLTGFCDDDKPPRLLYFDVQKRLFRKKFPDIHKEWGNLKIRESLPLVLPTELDPYDFLEANPTTDLYSEKFYKCYLHIVCETKVENTGFFSEKIFKPFIYFQPFVLIGQYQGLARLRQLGYKTFSDVIDESYDDEIDNELRVEKATNAAIDFLNRNDLHEVMQHLWPILDHNHSLLVRRFDLIFDQLSLDLKNLL